MFEIVNQGSCTCCGIAHGGLGMQEFMSLCSDLDTDDGKKEKMSPWPPFLRNEVWADRVKFRKILKERNAKFRAKLSPHSEAFVEWWLDISPQARSRCFMMPKEELSVLFNTDFEFKASYQKVLCAVSEQVEKFEMTQYEDDGVVDYEVFFERCVHARKGAWVVASEYTDTDDACDLFFGYLEWQGGKSLLPKKDKTKKTADADADGEAEGGGAEEEEGTPVVEHQQSFRADRRLIRNLVFGYFADQALRAFLKANPNSPDCSAVSANDEAKAPVSEGKD